MILVEATPDMVRERDRDTHQAWGGTLPVEAYLALEARLRRHPWPRAELATWLLCADGGEVLSSCETYRMGSQRSGEPGHSYGVASVYTAPDKRLKGYAGELLERLCAHLAGTVADAQAVVLYSDVALRVYQRSGFTARPALNLAFASVSGDPRDGVDALLREDGLAAALAGIPPPADPFAILPVPEQIDWHLERERIYSALMARDRPEACGARAGAGTVLWAADFRTGQLLVLLLHAPGEAEAAALLTCARRTAEAAGLGRTILWRTPGDRPWPGSVPEDRLVCLDSVPMLRPLDPRILAADWRWIPRALWV